MMGDTQDRRRDWRLYLLNDELGWQYHSEGSLAGCRRERDARIPGKYWTDWSIRRPEEGRPSHTWAEKIADFQRRDR